MPLRHCFITLIDAIISITPLTLIFSAFAADVPAFSLLILSPLRLLRHYAIIDIID